MADCCGSQGCAPQATDKRRARTLKAVLGINAVMFAVEVTAGLLIGSVALLADSLDMLGDALTYGISLAVVGSSLLVRARVALFKGLVMAASGLFVLGQTVYRGFLPDWPAPGPMAAVALLALAANLVCFGLLWRHRGEDINMRSVWLCSRNDLFANAGVLVAALGVGLTSSRWPDLIVGGLIAGLFLVTAVSVMRESAVQIRTGLPSKSSVSGP